MIDWTQFESHPPTMKPNKIHIPVNRLGFDDESITTFNEIYHYCLEKEKNGEFKRLEATKSCGISIQRKNIRGARWMITVKKTFIEILIRNLDARYYRFIVGSNKEKATGLSGRRAFQIFRDKCKKYGIDLDAFAIDNGLDVKKQIPSPRIKCVVATERTYENAHHIDLNSAYSSGIIEAFPALTKPFSEIYETRKLNDNQGKQVLAIVPGFMQSELCNYKWSHLTKAAFDYTLRKLDELTEKLKNNGNRILAYNTDGIWYTGDLLVDAEEGKQLGQWKHDHKNCTIRFKSHGCYEFIEDNKYTPVFRGESSYEREKPRDEWEWGDIFRGEVLNCKFIEGYGIYKEC